MPAGPSAEPRRLPTLCESVCQAEAQALQDDGRHGDRAWQLTGCCISNTVLLHRIHTKPRGTCALMWGSKARKDLKLVLQICMPCA